MHQINLERMSPVVHARDGVAFPDTLVGTDSHTPHVDALGVIAIGVGWFGSRERNARACLVYALARHSRRRAYW